MLYLNDLWHLKQVGFFHFQGVSGRQRARGHGVYGDEGKVEKS